MRKGTGLTEKITMSEFNWSDFIGNATKGAQEEPKTVSTIDYLTNRAALAVKVNQPSVLFEICGMIRMAWKLDAINTEEYSKLMDSLGEYGEGKADSF